MPAGDLSKYGFNANATNGTRITSVDISDFFREFVIRPAWREGLSVSLFALMDKATAVSFTNNACLEITYLLRQPKSGDTFRVKSGSDDVYEASNGDVYFDRPE